MHFDDIMITPVSGAGSGVEGAQRVPRGCCRQLYEHRVACTLYAVMQGRCYVTLHSAALVETLKQERSVNGRQLLEPTTLHKNPTSAWDCLFSLLRLCLP